MITIEDIARVLGERALAYQARVELALNELDGMRQARVVDEEIRQWTLRELGEARLDLAEVNRRLDIVAAQARQQVGL